MNLIIIALAILGVLVVAYAIIYALICDNSGTLPMRILSLIILIGVYAVSSRSSCFSSEYPSHRSPAERLRV